MAKEKTIKNVMRNSKTKWIKLFMTNCYSGNSSSLLKWKKSKTIFVDDLQNLVSLKTGFTK